MQEQLRVIKASSLWLRQMYGGKQGWRGWAIRRHMTSVKWVTDKRRLSLTVLLCTTFCLEGTRGGGGAWGYGAHKRPHTSIEMGDRQAQIVPDSAVAHHILTADLQDLGHICFGGFGCCGGKGQHAAALHLLLQHVP